MKPTSPPSSTPRLALVAAIALLAACGTARNNSVAEVPECQRCHGGASGNAAPPLGAHGETATTALAVGAHQAHLGRGTFTAPVACAECHVVPTDLGHLDGLAPVTFSGRAVLGGATPSWDRTSATCSGVACHGALIGAAGSASTPTWNAAGQPHLDCGGCHGNPPASHQPSSTNCNACHPQTVLPSGAIDLAGGHHLNGVVETPAGHGDFTAPATHGPQFFQSLAGAAGALDCASCHGAAYDGGTGPSCNACHEAAGWTGWRSNCSFCHGTKSPLTQAGYDVAARPEWAAPPDALAQRLDPAHAPVPERTGAHQAHLTGKGSTSGQAYAAPFPCATCHVVPTDEAHAGGPGRAPVALVGSGALPADLGSYAPDTLSCTTYCHGTTLADDQGAVAPPPTWTGGELGCAGCHGNPPASGQHAVHVTGQGYTCTVCHSTTVTSTGAIGGAHLDGSRTVVFVSPGVSTWDGTSCTAVCHVPSGPRAWR